MGPDRVPHPFAYGEKKVYFMLYQKFLPYVLLIDEKRLVNEAETFNAYSFFTNGMKS